MRFVVDLVVYFYVLRFVEQIDADLSTLRTDEYWKPWKTRRC